VDISIRQYRKDDRAYIRDIAYNTAFLGESAGAFIKGKDIFADFLTLYHTDYEPASCFVAEVDGRVVGYLLGANNAAHFRRIFPFRVFPRLLTQVIINGALLRKKNIIFVFHCLLSFLKREFKTPDFTREYPASLHVNIEQGFRNLGIGSRLVNAYLDYLRSKKIEGVYLATMSDKAASFFKAQGFVLLHQGIRSYFRHILHRDIPIYIYGKKLNWQNGAE